MGLKGRLLNYVKANCLFLIVMTISAIMLFALMYQVVLYADDYSVGVIAHKGIGAIIEDMGSHYMHWGGGFTPTIVRLLFLLGPIAWKVGVVIQVLLIIALTSRMICRNNAKMRGIAALTMWILFFSISIYLMRETVLWLDGSSAYLFTTLQTVLVFYFFYTRLFQGENKKYDLFLMPLVCFFGGWSSAQSGCVVVLIAAALILYKKAIRKEKIKAIYWVSLALSAIGFAIFYFAPGNHVRLATFDYYSNLSFPNKILYRLADIYKLLFDGHGLESMISSFFVMFMIGAISLAAFYKSKNIKSNKLKRLAFACSAIGGVFVFMYAISFLGIPQLDGFMRVAFHYPNLQASGIHGGRFLLALVPYLIASVAIVATIINAWILAKACDKMPFVLVAVMVALSTDFVMIFAPYSPIRTIIYSVFFSLIVIACVLTELIEDKKRILPLAALMLVCVDVSVAALFVIIYAAIKSLTKIKNDKKYMLDAAVLIMCLGLYALGNYASLFVNYRANRIIDEVNMQRIEEFKNSENDCELGNDAEHCVIVFAHPNDAIYGSALLVGADWIESSVRDFFGLPENVQLMYEEQ